MKPSVLRFPLEYSIGMLSVRSVGDLGDREWVDLAEARGEITVPDGLELRLVIDGRFDFDPNHMLSFGPETFAVLEWVSSSNITDSSIRHIRHLTGLKGLALWESHIGDDGAGTYP